ncbi:MAG: hypothetical protein V1848_00285 [Candidatus Magasanikbacteria bacterium]
MPSLEQGFSPERGVEDFRDIMESKISSDPNLNGLDVKSLGEKEQQAWQEVIQLGEEFKRLLESVLESGELFPDTQKALQEKMDNCIKNISGIEEHMDQWLRNKMSTFMVNLEMLPDVLPSIGIILEEADEVLKDIKMLEEADEVLKDIK